MNEVMLHPMRDFLNPRNPSSPFQYMLMMAEAVWKYIEENAIHSEKYIEIKIEVGKQVYFAFSKKQLFDKIKHHWGGFL